MRSISETIIDYYEGAYGYTIRMDIQMESWLTSLKEKTLTCTVELNPYNRIILL